MKLFVGNLCYEITTSDLVEFFAQAGRVLNARIITDAETGRSRGFGFVEMSNSTEAEQAIQTFHGVDAMGRPMIVSPAHDKRAA